MAGSESGRAGERRAALRDRFLGSISPLGLLCAGALLAVPLVPAGANPTGGTVVSGQATITQTGPSTLDIKQTTQRAGIDWKSFSIGANETTTIEQPNSGSVSLNRVTGSDPSRIAGQLKSNGQVVLINQNGIVFTQGAEVDVNSLIATTADIRNADFMAGKLNFSIPSTKPGASVSNAGRITVADTGLAALVAPSVANSGVIQAKLGKVVLAGAEAFTLDLYGDGLMSFDVTEQVKSASGGSLVSNSGQVLADGGEILLTADAIAGIVDDTIRVDGLLQAHSFGGKAGLVTIDAGATGSATVTGRVDVSGGTAAAGGGVNITGDKVALLGNAVIDASGIDGGTVKVGGGAHGTDSSIRNAQTSFVAGGALIDASARGAGNGGTVTVWSDQATGFAGRILGTGGASGGNGGNAEVSSAGFLQLTGSVDMSAPKGRRGTLLLDPAEITIVPGAAGTSTPAASFDAIGNYTEAGSGSGVTASTISVGDLIAELNGTDVAISTHASQVAGRAGTIEIATSINYTGSGDRILTFAAESGLTIDPGVVIGSSTGKLDLTLTAGNGTLTTGAGSQLSTHGGNLSLSGASLSLAGIANTNNGGAAGTITAIATNGITIAAGGALFSTNAISLTADTMSLGGPVGGTAANAGQSSMVRLETTSSGRAIGLGAAGGLSLSTASLLDIQATDVDIGNNSSGAITVGAISGAGSLFASSGTLSLTTGSSVTVTGALSLPSALTISAIGAITDNGGTGSISTTGHTSLTSSGRNAVTFGSASNLFGSVTAFGGAVTLRDGGGLSLGTIDASGLLTLTAGGAVTQTVGSTITSAGLSATATGSSITLFNDGNSFNRNGSGSVTLAAMGSAITLKDASSKLVLGTIDATGGALTVSATGPITQAAGGTIISVGLDVSSGSDIVLNNTGNNFANGGGTLTASGGTINLLNGSSSLLLETINASGALTIATTGDITQAAGTTITGFGSDFEANGHNVTLTNGGNQFARGGSAETLKLGGATIAVNSADSSLTLFTINATGTLAVTASGAVSQAAGTTITATGTTVHATGASVTLANTGNSLGSFSGEGTAIRIENGGALTLGAITASTSLDVALPAATQLTVTGPVRTTGTITLATDEVSIGAGIQLGGTATPGSQASSVTIEPVTSGRALVLGGTDPNPNGDLFLSTTALLDIEANQVAIGSSIAGAISVSGFDATGGSLFTTGTGGGLTLTSGGNVVVGGALKLPGTLTIDAASGSITDNDGAGSIATGGLLSLTAASASPISLVNAANSFGSVTVASGGAVTLQDAAALTLGTIDTSGTLTIATTGGALDQATGTGITVAGASLTASGAITLDGGANNFENQSGTFSAQGTALDIANSGALTVGSLTATNGGITLTNNGALTLTGGQVNAGAHDISLSAGAANLTISEAVLGTGAISLTGDTMSFAAQIGGSGANSGLASSITIETATGGRAIVLGGTADLSAGNDLFLGAGSLLGLRATNVTIGADTANFSSGAITLQALNAAGSANFTPGGTLTLASGGGVTVTGAVSLPNNLTILSGGNVGDQSGAGSISVPGTFSLTVGPTADVSLVNALNAFPILSISGGGDVALKDASALTIGTIDLTGSLALTAQSLTEATGATVTAAATSLTASGTVTVANDGNHLEGQFGTLTVSGTNVSLANADAVELGNVNASGSFTLRAGGAVTQSGTASFAAAATSLNSPGAITLTGSNNSFTTGGGVLTASGTAIDVAGTGNLMLGQINASGTLTVAVGGALTQQTGTTVQSGGIALSADGAITLLNAGNDFTRVAGAALTASGTQIQLADSESVTLGNITTAGLFSLTAQGGITQIDGATVNAGSTALAAIDAITLTNAGNRFDTAAGGSLAASGASIALTDAGALNLANVTTPGNLTLTAASLSQSAGSAITADGTNLGASGTITLTNLTNNFASGAGSMLAASGTTVSLTNAGALTIGDIHASGPLTLRSVNGSLAQASGASIHSVSADFSAAGSIELNNPGNDFGGIVSLSGGAIELTGAGPLTLGTINATEGLTVTAGGTLDQAAGTTINSAGATLSAGGAITLANQGNDFTVTPGSSLSVTGPAIDIANTGSLNLGSIHLVQGGPMTNGAASRDSAPANLILTSTGSITQSADGAIVAKGVSLTAGGDIILTNAGNDFESGGGALSASGVNIQLVSSGPLSLGQIGAAGSLALKAGGGVSQIAGTAISAVNAIKLTSGGAMSLGQISTGGTLMVDASGAISQDAGTAISAASAVQLTSGGAMSLGQISAGDTLVANAGGPIGQNTGTTISAASSIQLISNGSMSLGQIGAGGALVLNANGAISQNAGTTISASSLSGSSAGGAIFDQDNRIGTLSGFTNSGTGGFTFVTVTPLIVDAAIDAGSGRLALTTLGTGNDLSLAGDLSAGTSVTLTAAGTISQSQGIIQAPQLDGSAIGGVTLNDANQIATLAGFTNAGTGGLQLRTAGDLAIGGPVSAGSGDMQLRIAGNLAVAGTVSAGGDMQVTTGGGMTVKGGLSSGGTLTLVAGGAIDATGSISANRLTGSSVGGTQLTGTNNFNLLGNFQNQGTGALELLDNAGLTIDGDLHNISGRIEVVTAGALAIRDIDAVGQAILFGSEGAMGLTGGTFTATDRVVLTTRGTFSSSGTLNIVSPLFIADITGASMQGMLQLLPGRPSALVNEIDPGPQTAISGQSLMNFDNLQASATTALFIVGNGRAQGRVALAGLGVIGANGGSAGLQGTINSLEGGAAAEISVRSGSPDNAFQLNSCAIGSATCVVLPLFSPVVPQPLDTIELSNARQNFDDPTLERLNNGDEDDL
ncbi:MAG TPA: filamentous hemagglutinin N-terminal domain-containing protein [Aliidongia sp.]|nr:filamentous hemagglutinin N-terminal domain-containing protein [Aliidongia sp.]